MRTAQETAGGEELGGTEERSFASDVCAETKRMHSVGGQRGTKECAAGRRNGVQNPETKRSVSMEEPKVTQCCWTGEDRGRTQEMRSKVEINKGPVTWSVYLRSLTQSHHEPQEVLKQASNEIRSAM